MSDKLKPCPFCGNKAYIRKAFSGNDEWWVVGCSKCHSQIVQKETSREVIEKAWNRRVEK